MNNKFFYNRLLFDAITPWLYQGKVIILYDPRQVGKTTLVKKVVDMYPGSTYLNCERQNVWEMLNLMNNEVSLRELSSLLKISVETTKKYIHLLEKSIVLFALGSFSRNFRNEIAKSRKVNMYFWRTCQQKEIDLVEESAGELHAYEMKWGEKKPKPPSEFLKSYSNADFHIVNKENYSEFLL